MNAPARLYTPAEAAAVSGLGIKAVNNAIDKRIVDAGSRPSRGGATSRSLTGSDLLFLKLWYEVGDTLSQEKRQRMFDALRKEPDAKRVRAGKLLIVDVAEARKEIAARARDLEAAEAMVERKRSVMGGEPVFKGTRIPVRLIAGMLAESVGEAEILEGYPKLDRRKLSLSRIWAAAHPRRGRPRALKDLGLEPKSSRQVPLKAGPHPPEAAAE